MSEEFTIIECADHQNWLEARQYGIGGSDAAAILGLNPYKTNVELYEEKIGLTKPQDISEVPYVKFGTMAEPHIRQLFALRYPEYTVSHHENRILRSKKYPFMQASLDGELMDQELRRGILEIKTANIFQPVQYEKWKDRIPDHYYIQVLHYLLVTGYRFVVLNAYLLTNRGRDRQTMVKNYFIERQEVEEDMEMLLCEEQRFWECVEGKKKPGLILPEL